jgi:predicted lipoprotein
MLRLPVAGLLLFCIWGAPALAQDMPARDNRVAILRTARAFIIPRYEALSDAARAQRKAWSAFCASPREGSFGSLQAAYQNAADAWSGIEFVLYGPVGADFRSERMAHWPERKNAVGRALTGLLSRPGRDDLTPERFVQVSAAAQGLTAVERLLYEKDAARLAADTSEAGLRRCALGQAIAAGLERNATSVLEEWRRPGGTLAKLEAGDAGVLDEAATRLATDTVTLFEIIDDQKLGAVMGKNPDDVHASLAEGWRSGRSMRAIAVNLEAAEAMATALLDRNDDANASLFYGLRTARDAAAALPPDIGAGAEDPRRRRNLVFLRDAVHSLREVAGFTLPASLGITMGFNSRDGD